MTIQQLQYLLEVSRCGSVTQASRNLFVSHSSVSISLSNLEKELGYPLFSRTAKGLIPTARGLKVLEHARQICRSYTQLTTLDQEERRFVRISGGNNPFFVRAFGQVCQENADSDVRIIYQNSGDNESLEQLLLGQLHLSLRSQMDFSMGYWERHLKELGLNREILKTLPATVQVGKGHRLYDADKVLPHELKNDTLVDNPHNPISSNRLFAGTIYTDPETIRYAATPGAQTELVVRGLGYSICALPGPEFRRSDLRYIPLEGVSYHLLAITAPHHAQPPEVTRFLQILRSELNQAYQA